jgi:diguanylate cyclase (GGDEF)-like protein/PAS domain S-box-containing protein
MTTKRTGGVDRTGNTTLQEIARQTKVLLDALPIPVFFKDRFGAYIGCNSAFEHYLGLPAEKIIGSTVYDIAPSNLASIYEEADRLLMEKVGTQSYESTVIGKDGCLRDVVFHKATFGDREEAVAGLAGAIFDITDRKQLVRDHQESEERFRSVFEHAAVGMATATADGLLLQANQALCAFLGYDGEELMQLRMESLIHPANRAEVLGLFAAGAAGQQRVCYTEKQFLRKDRTAVWGQMTLTWLMDADSKPVHCVILVQDINRRKEAEQEIELLAYHDALTRLPNRALAKDRLIQVLAMAKRDNRHVGVLHIDLDRFKKVNDSLGHAIGDQLLLAVATRLSETVRESDTVARFGGDEFTIICPGIADVADVTAVARKIVEALTDPFTLAGEEVYLSASIGIAISPSDGDCADELLKHADIAMYSAKARGRNSYQFYCDKFNRKSQERLSLENGLRRALQYGEFSLVYQPQIDLRGDKMIGMEALVRWNHPTKGLINPAEFISLAEETGLIIPLGEWVLRAACAQTKSWQNNGLPKSRVAVNISGHQFKQKDFIDMVEKALKNTGLPPDCLELELTESIVMEDVDEAIMTIVDLKTRGINIAIDDFGTGYSSLSYLKHFPIDRLKIDQSFVTDITTDPDSAAITEAIIAMARSLGLDIVAEGVETTEQLDFLRERQCHVMQGFFFARPLKADDFHRYYSERSARQRLRLLKNPLLSAL